ncbi:MAG: glycoside hydrolase family 5 protein [Pseudomonadota bacterium]
MKKPILKIIAFGLSLVALPLAQADTFNTRKCINMGNALDAPNEGEWGHTIQATSFPRIAAAGFDTVRIPVRWSAHTGGAPDYVIDESFFARVTEVVDQALASDLQVILNIHHFEEINAAPEENRAKFLALWAQIGARYKDLPESVYFEVINEPNGQFKGDVMRSIISDGFSKIRETNPTRILIMGGENWSGIKSLPSIPSIDDPNQVYTFHFYDPFLFTHQKASWTPLKDSDEVRWGSRSEREDLKNAAAYARQVQDETGIPVFLGEVGAYEKAPYEDVVAYTQATREAFEAEGISWCVWSFTATFPFFDSERQQWDARKLGALGLTDGGAATLTPGLDGKPVADHAQSLEAAFNQLRRDVGYDGELMMLPFPDQLTHYGKLKKKAMQNAEVPGGEAIEVTVRRKGKNAWDAGLSGPLASALKAGDTLVMAYWARVVGGRDEGVIANAGLQMNSEPYTPLSTMSSARVTDRWQRFVVTTTAHRDYAPGEAGYSLQLAGEKQTLQIGPVFVLNLGQNIPQ